MDFDGIIFNFDGVIADSKRLSTAALVEGMAEAGLNCSLDEALREFSGRRWRDVLPLLEARMGGEIPESLVSQQYKRLSRKVILEVAMMPGVAAFLDMTRGIPRAIAAISEPIWITQSLARFGLEEHFGSHVFTTSRLTNDKPDPEIYNVVVAALGSEPDRLIAIEDNVAGISAAVGAGVPVIGFVAGAHILPGDDEAMRAAGASFIAHDFEEVADWIGWVS